MGYRSQVVIAISLDLYGKNKKEINKLLNDAEFNIGDRAVYFSYDSVKWYESYTDVANVMKFINANIDECAFLRLGEEHNDIEELGNCYEFDIYVNRELSWPTAPSSGAGKVLFSQENTDG